MLKNIQTLRFVAALWVVIHHLQPPVTPFRMTVLPVSVSELGFAGVDIFFVVSGFIMAQTTRNAPSDWRFSFQFLIRRFGRIYIGWWPLFMAYYFMMEIRPEIDLWGSLFLWPQDLMLYLLPITWTLSFELYFYLAVAILVTWSRKHAAIVLGIAAIVIVTLNIWFYQRGLYLPENEALAKASLLVPFYLSPLTLELIAGFLFSDWVYHRPSQCLSCWLTGTVLFLSLAYLYQASLPLPGSGMAGFFHVCERAVLFGGFALCLIACAVELERRKITSWTFLQALGDASYSIYLIHILLLLTVVKVFHKMQPQLNWSASAWSLLSLILILGISWVYFKLIERPLNNLLKHCWETSSSRSEGH